jgi:serine/threonine protein kinase
MQSIVQMAIGIAQGMNYLHSINQRIIHRDLKSQNILVDSHYTPKVSKLPDWRARSKAMDVCSLQVADFGLSHIRYAKLERSKCAAFTPRDSSDKDGKDVCNLSDVDNLGVTGTAEWMAPEVMEGAPYNQVHINSYSSNRSVMFTDVLPERRCVQFWHRLDRAVDATDSISGHSHDNPFCRRRGSSTGRWSYPHDSFVVWRPPKPTRSGLSKPKSR